MRISQKKLIYIISYFLIINTFLYRISVFQYIRAICLAGVTGYLIIKVIRNKIKVVEGSSALILLFLIVEAISTIVNGQNMISFIGSALVVVLGVLLIKTCRPENFELLLRTASEFSLLLLGVNSIVGIFCPNGFFSVSNAWGWSTGLYLLGQNINYYLLIILPFVCSFLLYNLFGVKKYIRINNIILIIYIYLGLFRLAENETTSALVCIMLLCSNFLVTKRRVRVKIPINLVISLITILFITVVFTNTLLSNPVVAYFFTNILHKSTNLTGRTYIWENALLMISQKPFLVYGVGAQVVPYIDGVYVSEHNQILHILIEGGILALIVFLMMITRFVILLHKINLKENSNLLVISLTGVSAVFLTVAFGLATSWVLYFIIVLAEYLNKNQGILIKREVFYNEQ